MAISISSLHDMISERDSLEEARQDLIGKTAKFQRQAKKAILEAGNSDLLSINWANIQGVLRRESGGRRKNPPMTA